MAAQNIVVAVNEEAATRREAFVRLYAPNLIYDLTPTEARALSDALLLKAMDAEHNALFLPRQGEEV